jgi:hypothetical protein
LSQGFLVGWLATDSLSVRGDAAIGEEEQRDGAMARARSIYKW